MSKLSDHLMKTTGEAIAYTILWAILGAVWAFIWWCFGPEIGRTLLIICVAQLILNSFTRKNDEKA